MYTLSWKPIAEEQLAQIWIDQLAIRGNLTSLVEKVEHQLKYAPLEQGESRSGTSRIVIVDYLAIFFDVFQDDLRVEVLAVRLL